MMWWPLLRNSMWLILSLSEHVTTLKLLGCNSARNVDIVHNQHPTVTCIDLTGDHGIFWSITDTFKEIRIAECKLCNPHCPPCSDTIEGYNVSRESNNSTTLQFLNTSLVTDGSSIKCSRSNNKTITATCKLFVITAYTIPECNIAEGIPTPIRCEGLVAAQNMYWTIMYGNGTVSPIAQCKKCGQDSQLCPNCKLTDSARNDFSVTREATSSTLMIKNNVRQKDGATIRCSKRDNKTHDDCTLCVQSEDFNLSECNSAGNFVIVQTQQPSLTCTGLTPNHTMYWSITDVASKTEIRIGECGNCEESCPPCSTLVEGYNVIRQSEGNTTLQFLNTAHIIDTSIITCSSVNNCSKDMCNIFVVPALRSNQATHTELPVAVVVGGAVGVVVIVAAVVAVVIALVIKRKRSNTEARKRRQNTVTLDDEFEEHINEFYQSADDPDPSPNSMKPNSPAPLVLANPTFDAEEAGSDGPQNHLHAQFNKGKKDNPDVSKEKPGKTQDVKQHNKAGKIHEHADKGGAVYTECVSDCKKNNSATNVYMNVEELPALPTEQDIQAAKHDSGNVDFQGPNPNTYINTATVQTQGDYTNVQSELNAAEGMTKTAETADEYRHLQFSTREPLEENPAYDHLTEL
ncbi:uncharacterized protein [Littorina saxatilis]|uniref:uncharacterized protein n=1 Tax=Littorina saxatilis TaxID=31220 RepID=UPI0038B42B0B